MLWQIIFLAAGILSLIYYSVICITLKKWDSTFSRFWLVLGGIGIFGSKWIGIHGMPCILEGLIGIGVCLLLISEIGIVSGMRLKTEKKAGENSAKWIIVLGAQVKGRKITDSLKRRLDAAYGYLSEHPEVKVVVSGGRGKGEDISEAAAMATYLERAGIERKRIVQEDASTNTLENLKYSRTLIEDCKSPVGIVSNNFHVYRGCMYAKRVGFENAFPIAAGCHPVLFLNYFIRECLAVWKLWLKKY